MIWSILFYGIIAVGLILIVSLFVYRIDWARHPEKYKDLDDPQKLDYQEKKKKEQKARAQKAKAKEKERQHQRRVDKINQHRTAKGKKPLDSNLKVKK